MTRFALLAALAAIGMPRVEASTTNVTRATHDNGLRAVIVRYTPTPMVVTEWTIESDRTRRRRHFPGLLMQWNT